jgi:hypothetical protein
VCVWLERACFFFAMTCLGEDYWGRGERGGGRGGMVEEGEGGNVVNTRGVCVWSRPPVVARTSSRGRFSPLDCCHSRLPLGSVTVGIGSGKVVWGVC